MDSRVKKEARSLISAGHEVRVYALASSKYPPGPAEIDGISVVHVKPDDASLRGARGLYTAYLLMTPLLVAAAAGEILAKVSRSILFAARKVPRVIANGLKGLSIGLKRLVKRMNARLSTRRTFKKYLDYAKTPLTRYAFAIEASRLCREWNPDVAHVHDLDTAIGGLRLAADEKCALVFDSHELWLQRNEPNRNSVLRRLLRRWEASLQRRTISQAQVVITVSPGISRILEESVKGTQASHIVVRNVPSKNEDATKATKQLQSRASEDVIAYSGRVTSGRNLELLIEACERLRRRYRLCLLGYGSKLYMDEIAKLADERGVPLEFVEAVPSAAVVPSLRLANTVFVGVEPLVESYRLALPNKFFEGVLSGRAVVAPLLEEMFEFGRDLPGIFWYDLNPESLTAALMTALDSSENWQDWLEVRRTQIAWEFEAERLIDAYGRLEASRKPGGTTFEIG